MDSGKLKKLVEYIRTSGGVVKGHSKGDLFFSHDGYDWKLRLGDSNTPLHLSQKSDAGDWFDVGRYADVMEVFRDLNSSIRWDEEGDSGRESGTDPRKQLRNDPHHFQENLVEAGNSERQVATDTIISKKHTLENNSMTRKRLTSSTLKGAEAPRKASKKETPFVRVATSILGKNATEAKVASLSGLISEEVKSKKASADYSRVAESFLGAQASADEVNQMASDISASFSDTPELSDPSLNATKIAFRVLGKGASDEELVEAAKTIVASVSPKNLASLVAKGQRIASEVGEKFIDEDDSQPDSQNTDLYVEQHEIQNSKAVLDTRINQGKDNINPTAKKASQEEGEEVVVAKCDCDGECACNEKTASMEYAKEDEDKDGDEVEALEDEMNPLEDTAELHEVVEMEEEDGSEDDYVDEDEMDGMEEISLDEYLDDEDEDFEGDWSEDWDDEIDSDDDMDFEEDEDMEYDCEDDEDDDEDDLDIEMMDLEDIDGANAGVLSKNQSPNRVRKASKAKSDNDFDQIWSVPELPEEFNY